MPTFATLGPAGSNHDINVRRYAAFHSLSAEVVCVTGFDQAFELLSSGKADFVVQACIHPQVGLMVGRHHPRFALVDSFLAPTVAMGVLSDTRVDKPRTLGLMPATRVYFDATRWPQQIELGSGVEVAHRLLAGELDSGFTELALVEQYPGRFRVDVHVGAVDIAWLVYGRQPVCNGGIVADARAPVTRQFCA